MQTNLGSQYKIINLELYRPHIDNFDLTELQRLESLNTLAEIIKNYSGAVQMSEPEKKQKP